MDPIHGFLQKILGPSHKQLGWSVEGSLLRFDSDHDGEVALMIRESSTCISIAPGVRIGRGTRIHLLGGAIDIQSGVTLGESIDIRLAHAITIGVGARIDDFTQLQSDSADLIVGAKVLIGRFTRLWAHNGPIALGDETTIGPSCTFIGTGYGIAVASRCDFTHAVTMDSADGSIDIASYSGVGPNSVLYGHGGLHIGSGVAIAGLTMIVPGNHRFERTDLPIRLQGVKGIPIEIGDNVWIGGGAVILGGAKIGDGTVVGAGSVVRGEIGAHSVVAGVPARSILKTQAAIV